MQRKAIMLGTVWVALSLFVLSGAIYAKSSSSTVVTKFETELEPCALCPEPEAEGDGKFILKTQAGLVKDKTFTGKVELPIPNTLGIIDATTAQSAVVHLILSRLVLGVLTQYADCTLAFAEIEQELEDGVLETEVEYKVDVRLKKGAVVNKKGSCVVNGIVGGLPDVLAGDVATVFVNGVQILEGTFA